MLMGLAEQDLRTPAGQGAAGLDPHASMRKPCNDCLEQSLLLMASMPVNACLLGQPCVATAQCSNGKRASSACILRQWQSIFQTLKALNERLGMLPGRQKLTPEQQRKVLRQQ